MSRRTFYFRQHPRYGENVVEIFLGDPDKLGAEAEFITSIDLQHWGKALVADLNNEMEKRGIKR